jgi:collagenase-like PrtC family protease
MRKLELLAPAKNLECGMAAIEHGADAVYIGASRFGARAAAGNSVSDIHQLCEYAHQFAVKVYVTVNTIIYDSELETTFHLIDELADAGVDALLVQDMSLIEKLSGSRLAIHASTQTDNRSADKVAWLQSLGCSRVVLARELSVSEIAAIHQAVPDVELEVFVHGALCVSYSGLCYASQYCFNRSANRGECAQFCRLKFDLQDADGKEIVHQRHLLSLKDLCQIDHLEELAAAGASSFKIEGRLKDVAYVKNVVSAYSERLNQIIGKHPNEYCRASRGEVSYAFTPNLAKTFNRGFTSYFLQGRQPDIASFDTPKALGEHVGHVKEFRGNSFNVAGTASFVNGDGLCFINDEHELEGFRVNKVEGNRLYPFKMPENLRPGVALYRNNDEAFEKILSGKTAERKILVKMIFGLTDDGFSLKISTEDGKIQGESNVQFEHQQAQKPQRDNILRQLSKLGDTLYRCSELKIEQDADTFFIPSSILSDLRRKCVESIKMKKDEPESRQIKSSAMTIPQEGWQPEYKQYPYLYNIANVKARDFYEHQGMERPQEAFEVKPVKDPLIMQCRHCIRYSLGYCVRHGGKQPTWREPLYLQLPDGRRFRLQFKCDECQMNIYAES